MSIEPYCKLTTKDHAILETMLERSKGPTTDLTRLLERKLRLSAVYFRDEIPPDVATVNSRVAYSIDGRPAAPRLIVQSEARDLPEFALSIHELHGLALLGLAEGEMIRVLVDGAPGETLAVGEVLFQPEARLANPRRTAIDRVSHPDVLASNVVALGGWRGRAGAGMDDDDPGPAAA